jgi:hypothetical protein
MDFRYLTESKNEFNNLLNSILIPHLYNGIYGMLEYSIQTHGMLEEKQKKNKNIQNPGIINIFKMCLNDVSSINNYEIDNEYKRIKENSGCPEWFDNLIKASFKSYVLFLTWDPKISNSKYAENDLYDKISLKDFIHKCYIETCIYFNENPEIFLKKSAKKEIYEIIKNCIELAIKKTLPYNDIIQEYLKINFTVEIDDHSQNKKELANIKGMVFRILSQNKYGGRPTGKALISDDSDERYNNYNHNSENGRNEMQQFINEELDNDIHKQKEYNNENHPKEIFKLHSATNSRHNSLKSKSNNESETSDDFQVPEAISRSFRSNHSSKSNKSSRQYTKENDILNGTSLKQEPETVYQEITNDTGLIQNGGKLETTTQIMTRSETKRKELENVINNTLSATSITSKTSKISKNSKTASHLNSPIAIKKNQTDRIYDDITPPTQNGGKRTIQIIKNKSNTIHDKVNNMNSYFTNLIK